MSPANPASAVARAKSKKASEQFEAWFTGWRLVLLVFGLMLLTFPTIFFKGEVFAYKDASIFNYPTHFYYRDSLLKGELPLWNPYNDCGIPFLAQWNVMVLYPFSLFYLLPAPWSISLFSIAHLLLAALGMYYLAYRWTNSRFAASVAGLAFAWNGLTLHAVNMWPNSCASYAWMPWAILLMHRAMTEGGRSVLYAGIVGALQMLCGVPEIILYTWLIIFGLFGVELFFGGKRLGTASQPGNADVSSTNPTEPGSAEVVQTTLPSRPKYKIVIGAVLAGLIVTGLSAAQMLPFLDLLQHSQRSSGYATDTWAMPKWGWANFLVPVFRLSPDFLGVFNQTEQLWTTMYYLGVVLIALAIFAAWRVREPKVWFLVALAVIGCVLALGKSGYVYEWVRKAVPFLGIMRYPSKWVQFAMFAVPLLAAYAIAWLQARENDERSTGCGDLLKIGGTLLLMIGVILLVAKAHQRAEDEPWQITWINGGVRAVFLAATLGLIANLFSQSPIFSRRTTGIIVLVLLGLDISSHQPKRPPTVPGDSYRSINLSEAMSHVPKLGESRAMQTGERKATMRKAGYYEPKQDMYGKRITMFMNVNLYDHVPKVDGLSSLYLKHQAEVENVIYYTNRFTEPLCDFLGVAEISHPSPELDYLFSWLPRSSFLPIGTIGQKPVFASDDESLKGIFSESFRPKEMVYLPREAEGVVKAKGTVSDAKAEQVEFKAQRVRYKTESSEPTLFGPAQTYQNYWKAYVDGTETPVWRANHAYQAVEVPAGKHEVRLVYEDKLFRLGAMVSGATLVLVFVAWFWLKKKTPREVSV